MKEKKLIQVECYSGHTYGQRPVTVILAGDRLEIEEIIGEWKMPDGKAFHLRAGDREFTICYLEEQDIWVTVSDQIRVVQV